MTGCVVDGCPFAAAQNSAYCALHGVKWGRGGSEDLCGRTNRVPCNSAAWCGRKTGCARL